MQCAKLLATPRGLLPARWAAPQRSSALISTRQPRLVVRASQGQPEEKTLSEQFALPLAAMLGAAMLFAGTPDEALAARSGGRVGGSGGFSRRAPAPAPRAAPRTTINNNYIAAPPVIGGWGFGMPFFPGYGMGYGYGFGLSSIFNMFVLFMVISVVWSVISNFTNGGGGGPTRRDNTKSDDEW